MANVITTTISQDMWNLAKEKAIRWSDALEKGIKVLATGKYMPDPTQTYQETDLCKVKKLQTAILTMQNTLDEVNARNDKLENALQKERKYEQ